MQSSSVESLLQAHCVPGAAVGRRARGRWLRTVAGLRDVERALPVEVDTPFEVGSLSKPLFAVAVLQLVAEGALDLDAPLDHYLDKTELAEPELAREITPRQLLTHCSGLPNWRPDRWTDRPGPLALAQPTGRGFRYSGEGYQLLQAIVEAVTGNSLEALMRARVLDPLGMSASSYTALPGYAGRIARGYAASGAAVPELDASQAEALAAASLKSTVPDLILFIEALVARDARERLLLPASPADLFFSPRVDLGPGLGWSLGWGVEVRPEGNVAWHWCNTRMSFWAFAAIDAATGDAIIALTNAPGGSAVCESLVRSAIGGPHPAFTQPPLGPRQERGPWP